MLRGINVGGRNKLDMAALRVLYQSLKLEDARTLVQSGNVIFRSKEKGSAALAKKIQNAIARQFGCRPEIILRTTTEMRAAINVSPFAGRRDLNPGKLLVTFLAAEPAPEAQIALLPLRAYPEELHLSGRELYIYFPNGAGKSKLPWPKIAELLKTTGTARNWNSVTKMLKIAEEMEASE